MILLIAKISLINDIFYERNKEGKDVCYCSYSDKHPNCLEASFHSGSKSQEESSQFGKLQI